MFLEITIKIQKIALLSSEWNYSALALLLRHAIQKSQEINSFWISNMVAKHSEFLPSGNPI